MPTWIRPSTLSSVQATARRGERCMAVSVAVPVGKKTADILVEKLIPRVESLEDWPVQRSAS